MRFRPVLALGILALGLPAAVLAQALPAPGPPAPPKEPSTHRVVIDSAFALQGAYRTIGRAEQAGAGGHYVDAAKSHYRSALDRRNRNDDAGASAEARLSQDLARVALDEHPPSPYTGPKDIPAPPTPRAGSGLRVTTDGPMPPPGADAMMDQAFRVMGPDGLHVHAFGDGMGPGVSFGFHHAFDPTALAEVLKVEKGVEAHQLAQNAVDANAAAQKAALAGNVQGASRQSRLAGDLMRAVHDLAALNHPELRHRTPGMQVMTDTIEVD